MLELHVAQIGRRGRRVKQKSPNWRRVARAIFSVASVSKSRPIGDFRDLLATLPVIQPTDLAARSTWKAIYRAESGREETLPTQRQRRLQQRRAPAARSAADSGPTSSTRRTDRHSSKPAATSEPAVPTAFRKVQPANVNNFSLHLAAQPVGCRFTSKQTSHQRTHRTWL